MATDEAIIATEAAIAVVEAHLPPPEEEKPAEAEAKATGKAKKEPKAKKLAAPRKPKAAAAHPTYIEMITEAISTLKERTGSSQYAIAKFIEEKHKNPPANFKKLLLTL